MRKTNSYLSHGTIYLVRMMDISENALSPWIGLVEMFSLLYAMKSALFINTIIP